MSVTVAQALATVTNKQIGELQPLGESTHPEILDRLCQSHAERAATPLSVSFVYEEHPITVTHEGEVRIYSPETSEGN